MDMLDEYADEESTFAIACTFTDEDGTSMAPDTLKWKLTDEYGAVINERSEETESASETVNIVLTGDDLAVPNSEELVRVVTIWGEYTSNLGNSLKYSDEIAFVMNSFVGIT